MSWELHSRLKMHIFVAKNNVFQDFALCKNYFTAYFQTTEEMFV
jgi:hypothetical protein